MGWVQNTACFLFSQLFDNYETSEEGAEHAYDALKTFLTQVRDNRDLHFFLLQFSPIIGAVVYVHLTWKSKSTNQDGDSQLLICQNKASCAT